MHPANVACNLQHAAMLTYPSNSFCAQSLLKILTVLTYTKKKHQTINKQANSYPT